MMRSKTIKSMKRIVLSVVLVASLMLPTGFGTITPVQVFTDVPVDHYAYDAINRMNTLGILTGYPDGSFKPGESVKRVEFAVMMTKALKLEIDQNAVSTFNDMDDVAWAIPFVEAAKPYLTGYASKAGYTFKPADPSVREDMAVALVKALKKPIKDEGALSQFTDAKEISQDLRKYVASAIEYKLMAGYPEDGKFLFKPQSTLTRAEAASLLMNVINEEKITFDDQDIKGNKVVFGDEKKPEVDKKPEVEMKSVGLPSTLKVVAQSDGSLLLKWSKASSKGFNGYKVVASTSDTTPKYPDNGYYRYITDINEISVIIDSGDGYNSGDVGEFESGETYYFSITTLYDGGKVTGNVVKVKMP